MINIFQINNKLIKLYLHFNDLIYYIFMNTKEQIQITQTEYYTGKINKEQAIIKLSELINTFNSKSYEMAKKAKKRAILLNLKDILGEPI